MSAVRLVEAEQAPLLARADYADGDPGPVRCGIRARIATTVESIADVELDRLCALHRELGVALLRLVEGRP